MKAAGSISVEQAWRQPVQDWVGARERVETDPEWAEWLDRQQTKLREWMNGPHERVEWVTGWGHEFVSPRDGSNLIWTAEVPGEDRETLASPSDPNVTLTPAIFRAWVTKYRGRNIIRARDAARLGRLLEERSYLDWAAAQLDFYTQHWADWPEQNRFYGPSRLFGQPLMDAAYLNYLVETSRLLGARVPAERRERWEKQLFLPQAHMLGESMPRIHNIAVFLRAAAAHVALEIDDAELWQEAVDGEWGLRRQLREGVTADGFWFEQSIGYHEFALSGLIPFLHTVAMQGRGAEFELEMAITRRMIEAPNGVRFADDTLPNPADNAALRLRKAPLQQVLRQSYRFLPSPLSWREAKLVRSWPALIDPPPALELDDDPGEMAPVVSAHFESTRFAQMKAEGWQVFFHYGQLTASHAQADLLNFEAYFGDTPITLDPHTVGYGSPMHADYFTRGLCHNVALIDGQGAMPPIDSAVPGNLPQRGEMLRFDAEASVMRARQKHYREGVVVERTLAVIDGSLHDTVVVAGEDAEPRALGLALHLEAEIKSARGMQSVVDFAQGRPVAFTYWQEVNAGQFENEAVFQAVCADGRELEIRFEVSGEFTVATASVPDSPVPERRMAFYLETKGQQATFRTVITPLK